MIKSEDHPLLLYHCGFASSREVDEVNKLLLCKMTNPAWEQFRILNQAYTSYTIESRAEVVRVMRGWNNERVRCSEMMI